MLRKANEVCNLNEEIQDKVGCKLCRLKGYSIIIFVYFNYKYNFLVTGLKTFYF